jgi:hypothetical protein
MERGNLLIDSELIFWTYYDRQILKKSCGVRFGQRNNKTQLCFSAEHPPKNIV